MLVTNKGYALYVFPPDRASRVSCTGDCADGWPPLVVPAGDSVAAGDGVRADLLGTMPAHGGTRVVTYHGWPLYTYLGDSDPGHAAGQGKYDDGGYWYVMRPSEEEGAGRARGRGVLGPAVPLGQHHHGLRAADGGRRGRLASSAAAH